MKLVPNFLEQNIPISCCPKVLIWSRAHLSSVGFDAMFCNRLYNLLKISYVIQHNLKDQCKFGMHNVNNMGVFLL